MSAVPLLDRAAIDAWIDAHPSWSAERDGDGAPRALLRVFPTADFAEALAFAVRLGARAEARGHHPDLRVRWGALEVRWTTHDAGGVTALDLALATDTDAVAGG
jgi:4a-hydroxytetrahydrobiopterin dehydratase